MFTIELIQQMLPVLFAGMVLGCLINLTGVGGGVITIPVLSVLFNMDIAVAIGTASFYVSVSKFFAGIEHARIKNIDYRVSLVFFAGALPGVLLSSFLVMYLLDLAGVDVDGVKQILKYFVIAIILFSIAFIAYDKFLKPGFKHKGERRSKENPEKLPLAFTGGLIGLVMGASGVGGGVLIIPSLMKMTGLGTKKIIGTSIFLSLVISFITAFIYAKGNNLDYDFGIALSVGSFAGIPLGTFLIKRINERLLEILLLLLVFFSSILMLVT